MRYTCRIANESQILQKPGQENQVDFLAARTILHARGGILPI